MEFLEVRFKFIVVFSLLVIECLNARAGAQARIETGWFSP